MALQSVKEIIFKAGTDKEFRETLINHPERIFESFELSSEEKQSLLELNETKIANIVRDLQTGDSFNVNDIRI